MILYMKAIQITLDEALLARLDQDEEVKRDGRSAVLRRAADLYLRQRKAREVAAAYRRAYAEGRDLGREFEGWEREGAWPAE
jgi:metal-responsive CopG/Arc/MetJ family transcriptional regulator